MLQDLYLLSQKVSAQVTRLLEKTLWHTLANLLGVVCVYFGTVTNSYNLPSEWRFFVLQLILPSPLTSGLGSG